jgi:hypothetical protein
VWGAAQRPTSTPKAGARTGTDLPPEAEAEDSDADEVPTVVYYCPACAEREFGDW